MERILETGERRLSLRTVFEPRIGLFPATSDLVFLHQMAINPETRHLTRPCRDQKSFAALGDLSVEEFAHRFKKKTAYRPEVEWIIEAYPETIGSASLIRNPPNSMALSQTHAVAWIGLEVALDKNRRLGLGSMGLELLERECHSRGFQICEAGVLEFNQPSLNFFKKNGYRAIGQSPSQFWFQGRLWTAIHLTKKL